MLTLPITHVYVEEMSIHMGGSKGKGVATPGRPCQATTARAPRALKLDYLLDVYHYKDFRTGIWDPGVGIPILS